MIKVDFHVHTKASDGLLCPSEVVNIAHNNNVQYLAITDHDTVSGIDEAVIEARKLNICLIPGVELSTQYNDESIHILGFFKDNSYKDKNFLTALYKIQNHRIIRAKKIIEKLKSHYNISINFEDVAKTSKGTIARPHIAAAIINAGYNYTHDEIFDNFIGRGCGAYVPTIKLSTNEGINLLKKYNANVFLAHPKLIKHTHITEFLKMNLDGIEAVYYQNTKDETEEFIKIAKDYHLLISCGSDFHGIANDTRHGNIGTMTFKDEYLNSFLKSLNL